MKLLTTLFAAFALSAGIALAEPRLEPLPISPLWKSAQFQKAITGSYGIDSRIEPNITIDEEEYLKDSAELMAKNDRPAAIALLEKSSLLDGSPAMQFTLATLRFEAGEAKEAIEAFHKVLERSPNFRDAHRNLAVALIEEKETDDARSHLIRAVELGANDGLTMGLLGYCHSLKENFQSSLQSYRLAQITMPDEVQWKMGEALALQQTGEQGSAIALYREVLKLQPTHPVAWRNLAFALEAGGNREAAINAFVTLDALGLASASELVALGHLYVGSGLPDEAETVYTKGFTAEEPQPLAQGIRALQYLGDQDYWSHAERLQKTVTATYPDAQNAALTRLGALIDFENGRREQAMATIRELVKSDPLDGQAIIQLGRFLQAEGKNIEAEMVLEQAAVLDDHAADALLELGRMAVAKGDYEKAVERLERSNQLKPDASIKGYLDAVKQLLRPR